MTSLQDLQSDPMMWIGIYIAIASLLCALAMAADLIHGFRNKKLWFPCKYFSLNAASMAVITVTMKLPVDLSSHMFSYTAQAGKPVSLAFMCVMMANFLPSLAAMDNKTLLANIIGLSILVITMTVNIFIYINILLPSTCYTISDTGYNLCSTSTSYIYLFRLIHIYSAIMLLLLVIMIASSLTIPTTKEILEVRYQTTNKTFLTHQHLQDTQTTSTIQKLREHVRRYWIMAETGSPQFVTASNPLAIASGVICVMVLIISLPMVVQVPKSEFNFIEQYDGSDYKWSIYFVVITQYIGALVGAIAPIFRCFSVLSFKLATKWNRTTLMVLKVENYWTQKLCEWKRSPIRFLSSSTSRTLVYNSKSIILSLCIRLQKVTVIFCKVISLIPTVIAIFVAHCFLYYWKPLKTRLFTQPIASEADNSSGYLSKYALQLDDEVELAEKILTRISNSMNSFISKAEKEQKKDLLKLLEKSTGFEGVENFDNDHVQPLLSFEIVNNWSLPIVTLTCIAVVLPNIHNDRTKSLLKSVSEGLSYTHQVERILNRENTYVNVRKATIILWNEVEHKRKRLDKALEKDAVRGKKAIEILKWFSDRAKETVRGIGGVTVENASKELIAANSMYRIANTILLRDEGNTEQINEEQLFALLSGMIADIFSACFTNIPQVITVKCNERVIEKREASVRDAAKLLGKTRKIIERLETCDLPRMDLDKMSYVDEWRLYLKQSIP